jgi:3-methyl-2-oxobutanoate hydroxymethyltransferase
VHDVRNGLFPGPEHSSRIDSAELAAALSNIDQTT